MKTLTEKQYKDFNLLIEDMAKLKMNSGGNFQTLDIPEELKLGFLHDSGEYFTINIKYTTGPKLWNKEYLKQISFGLDIAKSINEMSK